MTSLLQAVVLMTALLGAGKTPPSPLRQAKIHFRAGQVVYKLGRFEKALDEFSKAYEAKPLPAFLFNIGQCHFQLKNYERAVFFYEGYLRDNPPNVGNRGLVEDLLKDARAQQLALEESKKPPPTVLAVQAPSTVPASSPAGPATLASASEPASAPSLLAPGTSGSSLNASVAPSHAKLSPLGVTGGVLAGAGVVALGVGTYFGLHANSLFGSIHYGGGTSLAAGTKLNMQANQAAYQANGMFIAGGAAAFIGVTLLVVDLLLPKGAPVAVAGSGLGGMYVAF